MTPLAIRFWSHVHRTDRCWLWIGATKGADGRGQLKVDGVHTSAPRASWALHTGRAIPRGRQVLHRPACGDAACVRPSHLYLGSRADNIADLVATRTACPRGHAYTRDTVGRRVCRPCATEATRRWRSRAA